MLFKLDVSPWACNLFNDANWPNFNWEEFCRHWPLATDEKPSSPYSIKDGPCRLKDEEAQGLINMGCKLEIVPYPGAMVTKMQDRAAWDHSAPVLPDDIRSGAAVQISVADMALMCISEVRVEEDCCTDALQSLLDDGWRMLAICPPNAARRPDYILGRVKR